MIKPENVNKFVIVQEYDSKYFGIFHYDEALEIPPEFRLSPSETHTMHGFYKDHEVNLNTAHIRKINTYVYKKYLYGELKQD